MRHMAAFLAAWATLAAVGCGPKVVTIQGVEPGSKEIASIKRMAVLDLACADKVSEASDHDKPRLEPSSVGRDFANTIVAELDQTGAFEVMERSAIAKLVEEKDLTLAMSGDAAAASTIGKILKVDGVVVGEVSAWRSGIGVIDKKAAVGANLRLLDVKTAQVIVSYSQTKNSGGFLGGERPELILNQLAKEIAGEFVAKLAPHYVDREKYMLETGGAVGKPNSLGIKMASNRLWDKAHEQFDAALKIDNNCAAAHNNHAVCLENDSQLAEALREYEIALSLAPENEYIQRNLVGARQTLAAPQMTAKEALEKTRRDAVAPTTRTRPSE